MYVYLQIFFKDLEFSDCKRPILTIFFSVLHFNCLWMYWKQTCINCDMIAPEFFLFPSFSGQTDNSLWNICVFVCFGVKKQEPNVTLRWWNTLCKKVAILSLVYLFVNIQMNLFNYLYVVMPRSSQDNLALSSKRNTTKRTEMI